MVWYGMHWQWYAMVWYALEIAMAMVCIGNGNGIHWYGMHFLAIALYGMHWQWKWKWSTLVWYALPFHFLLWYALAMVWYGMAWYALAMVYIGNGNGNGMHW
jgi:hypothetical protein